jgi:hypothetical protein
MSDAHDLEGLFALPPGEFVAARDRLVRQLRAEQRRDDAAAVKALRRPTVAVWALNQLARREPAQLGELLDAAESLREAQARAVSGAGGPLRDATRRFGELVESLADRANAIVVGSAVASDGRRDEIAGALRTAAADQGARDDLRHGRMTQLPDLAAGLDMWSAGAESADAPPVAVRAGALLEEAERHHARLVREANSARERLERFAGDVAVAERRLAQARQKLDDARDDAADRERAAADSERELQRLRRRAGRDH